jgi:hypothetical protein
LKLHASTSHYIRVKGDFLPRKITVTDDASAKLTRLAAISQFHAANFFGRILCGLSGDLNPWFFAGGRSCNLGLERRSFIPPQL